MSHTSTRLLVISYDMNCNTVYSLYVQKLKNVFFLITQMFVVLWKTEYNQINRVQMKLFMQFVLYLFVDTLSGLHNK